MIHFFSNIFDSDAFWGYFSKETQFNLNTYIWLATDQAHLVEKYDAFGGIHLKVSIEI